MRHLRPRTINRGATWISRRGDGGELYAYPPQLDKPGFSFEDFFDYNMQARQRFHLYVHGLCHREAQAIDRSNSYLRITRKQSIPLATHIPTTLYCELDEDRREVRKVEEFGDGRVTYAWIKDATGTTRLRDQPHPPVVGLAANTDLEVTEIDRAAFDERWSHALNSETP